jgi:pimeloyl-ACP methyl ester carboxylesterase
MDDKFFKLNDGRTLAYRITGPEGGIPVFFFHGMAQSRLTIHPDISILDRLGVRLVTIDRPGIGLSSPLPGRTLLQWPHDIAALADHLNFPRYALIGHSAGAPHVLACTYVLSDKIFAATIVSGVCPPSLRMLRFTFASKFWKLGLLAFFIPVLTRPLILIGIRYIKPRDAAMIERDQRRLPSTDRAIMADPAFREVRIRSRLESFRQGAEGLYEDVAILRKPWGFDLSMIELPIHILHGEADSIVCPSFGVELARLVRNAEVNFQPNQGHYLIFSDWENILQRIREVASGNRIC